MLRLEAQIDLQQGAEAAKEEASADEEDAGERDLGDDQGVARGHRGTPRAALVGGVVQRLAPVPAREAESGQQAAGDAGESRQSDGEGERRRIDPGILQQGHPEGLEAGQGAGCPHGERHADHGAGTRKEQALGQGLSHEVAAAGAKSDPDRELLAPHVQAGKQQVGEVHAGDGKHAKDGAREHEKRGAKPPSQGFAQGPHRRAERSAVRNGLPQPLR